jgi:hypothetical protein
MNNQGRRGTVGFGGLGFVVSGIAAGVGLASEIIQHHKEKKAAKKAEAAQREPSGAQSPLAYEEHEHKGAEYAGCKKKSVEQQEECSLEEGDEEQWDLDDAQDLMNCGTTK